jgi:oligopeptide/dipeptide ABC transporter ATP-binding protein
MVFQNASSSLNPVIRVGDQIADVVREHEDVSKAAAAQRAVETLRSMGLSDPERNARAYPHQLSGGMAQRTLLGMALACRPRVLVADEPTTGLDPVIQEQVLDRVVEQVRSLDSSLIVISHDISVIAHASTHVAVMYAGSVVERASIDDVFTSPAHPYTRALLSATGLGQDGRFAFIPGRVPTLRPGYEGCAYRDRCALRDALGSPDDCVSDRPVLRSAGTAGLAACHHVEAA